MNSSVGERRRNSNIRPGDKSRKCGSDGYVQRRRLKNQTNPTTVMIMMRQIVEIEHLTKISKRVRIYRSVHLTAQRNRPGPVGLWAQTLVSGGLRRRHPATTASRSLLRHAIAGDIHHPYPRRPHLRPAGAAHQCLHAGPHRTSTGRIITSG